MIKRARKMEDLMDFQSLSLFLDVRLPPKFKMPTLDKWFLNLDDARAKS